MKDQLYRFYEILIGDEDSYEVELMLQTFPIIRRTKQGAWICYNSLDENDPDKFVLLTARKQFACETIEEAKESYKARKKHQIRILQARLERALRALRAAERDNWSITG